MASVSYHIANLLEKMTSSDKDFRFMATNDLMTELQKDSIKLDDDSERKVVKMLLKLLEDKNGEVQNLAVKCLGPLVNKVKEYQVETIVDTLCFNMVSDKEQLRDISSIGLKTVIGELPPTSSGLAAGICKRITGRLSSAISKQEDVSVQLEALDILGDLLSRFGGVLIGFHGSIEEALLPQLSSPRLAVRKRSITALGHLVQSCNNPLFQKMIDFLLDELSKNGNVSTTRTYIQCIAAISHHAGHRFGEYLERVMPFIVRYCKPNDDDELREYCIQAFESFVTRCPKEISPHIPTIVKICLDYLCYDPNYNYDEEEQNGVDGMETDALDDTENNNSDYSDDDDMSWKVRRASAKCIQAVIATRPDLLIDFYRNISMHLVNRFKEREENVRCDIFQAYMALLRQTRSAVNSQNVGGQPCDPDAMDQEDGPTLLLQQQVPIIVKALSPQLRDKSIKTRQGCFALLSELVNVLPGCLTDHIAVITQGVLYSLGDRNSSSNMKIDTLTFLHCLFVHHQPEVFHPHIPYLIPAVITCVGDQFYKIISEALLVMQQVVRVIRPDPAAVNPAFDFTKYVGDIYSCTLVRLRATDIDQEVKERAIACMGVIICHFADCLLVELNTCLPIFLDRLCNEITRLTTVKALIKIALSPLLIDIRIIFTDALPTLASFLRKNQRALKLSTLTLINAWVLKYGEIINQDAIRLVMQELPPLINESDLHVSQLTLVLLSSISKKHPQCMAYISEVILNEVLILTRSPLLQGAALYSLLEFFQNLVELNMPGLGYQDLLNLLTKPIYNPLGAGVSVHAQPFVNSSGSLAIHKQAFYSIAKCVAALTIKCPQQAPVVISQFMTDVQNPKTDSIHLFALLAIGEIGRHVDLSGQVNLKSVILDSFGTHSEEVKAAASFTLGNVSVGNLKEYLPYVLNEIETQPKRQYLLLHSLKEIINCQSTNPATVETLQPYVTTIWNMLLKHCECSEEGTRNVVAECLGKLTIIDPQSLLPKLKLYLDNNSPVVRSTVVTAIKFTISDQPQAIDPLLRACIGDFLRTLEDEDLNVRRVALVAFNSAAHNKALLIRDLLDTVLPQLYNETKIRKELIREVEMGPFKHTVDDGLDIRKAAFECMYTLLDTCLDRLDIFEFLNQVENGLKDHYDIKMLTYLMLVRLASLCPNAVLQRLDRIMEPLRTTCLTKVKANAVKQEYEKQDELKRSAMRAVASLLTIPDADKNSAMNEFLSSVRGTPELQVLFDSIQKDTSNSAMMSNQMDSNFMDIN